MRILKSILLFTCLAMAMSASLHASTFVLGTIESRNEANKTADKYSLRNLNSLTHKASTFNNLKSSLEFKGMTFASNLNTTVPNYLKYNKGNISYVIPYRFKIVLPRFKTPSPDLP